MDNLADSVVFEIYRGKIKAKKKRGKEREKGKGREIGKGG
jgi:hypothetical protein